MEDTIYTCDVCGNKSSTKLPTLDIRLNAHGIVSKDGLKRFDVCEVCCKRFGFTFDNYKQCKNKKTLEDKLIDILTELGVIVE